MYRAAWAAISGLSVVLATGPAQASPADLYGFGPRGQAMAGMGAAVGRGFEATYGNPALLSYTRHRELSVGWQSVSFSLQADGDNAPGDVSEDGLTGTFIGAVLPIPFGGFLEDRVTLGLGVFTPSSLIARARLLYPERIQFPLLTDRSQTLNFNMGVGVDLGHGIRVGAGALALAELTGTVVVRTDSSGRVGTAVDDQLIATYAPIAGAAYSISEDTEVGLTFRGALEADFDVVVQVYDLGSLVIPNLNISGVAQYDPLQLQAEIAHRFDQLTLAGGVTWKHWSAFEGWQKATVECPASNPDCLALVPEPVGFKDVVIPRVGVMYDFSLSENAKAQLRAGYAFEPSPVPEQTGLSNYLDSTRQVIAVGYGLELAEPLPPVRLDFFYQQQLLMPRKHEKAAGTDPANAGYPSVESSGHVFNSGVIAGVKF
jgi:long-chain fatty acid transport protein